MKYIESPTVYIRGSDHKAIFLAGGITNCPNWQAEITVLLNKYKITILNPRRKNFPINDPNASKDQIRWEFDHLRKADIVLFWFPKESICPIALYELGSWSMTDKSIFIGVDKKYERRIDIEEQTSLVRPEINLVYSLVDLSKQIIRAI